MRASLTLTLPLCLALGGCGASLGGEADAASPRDGGTTDGALDDAASPPDVDADAPDLDAGAPPDAGPRERLIALGDPEASWVYAGDDDRLAYRSTDDGDRVPDFSAVGYEASEVAIPDDVPMIERVEPGSGDDSARIQAAIDRVSMREPDASGFRGAVLLARGRYEVGTTLRIATSGVVLRGEGSGEDGTVLTATGDTQRDAITLAGSGTLREISGSRRAIADDYVPVGATWLTLEHTRELSVGDQVVVYRPATAEWIADIGMDRIAGSDVTQWDAASYHLRYEREIVAIDGERVELDAPIVMAIDARRYERGALYRSEHTGRIDHVGVEHLRLVSTYRAGMETSDEAHAWTGVGIDLAEHAWARDVIAEHFGYSAVSVRGGARFVTVEDCQCLDPVSQITGSRRYSFEVNGQRTLVQRCHARGGRHDYVTGSRVRGPNVFLDCTAEDTHSDIGPHHRWATGTLYDDVRGGLINVQDRGDLGSGHGWAGANHVLWNVEGSTVVCQQPPTAMNWCIGIVGRHGDGYLDRPDGQWELEGTHARPESLFLAQLEDRLGSDAVRAIATDAQLE